MLLLWSSSLSLAKEQLLLTWTLSPLVIWYFGLTALFLFLLERWLWCTCQLPSLWPRGYSLLFGRPSILLLPCWSLRHSARSLLVSAAPTSLPLLFSSYLTLALSSPPYPLLHLSFYLNLSGRSGRNCLLSLSVSSGYNRSPDTRFCWGILWLMSWSDGKCYLRPQQSVVVSLPLSLVCTVVFSQTGGVLSLLNSLTHKFPQFPPRNLPSSRSVCSLSSTLQWTQPLFKFLSLQNWESFLQRLRTLVPGHLSFHSGLSSYRLFAPLALWRLSASLRPLVQALGSCLASWASWSSAMPPSLRKRRVTTTTTSGFN